jgi:hypothetical protein
MRVPAHGSQVDMWRVTLICLFCVLYSTPLWAAEYPYPNSPVYNPHSKSYFQLFADNENPGNWEAARTRAGTKSFKGVRGRLAVINSAETHDFVLQTFQLTRRKVSVWIGLRYWCSARLLQWEADRPFSPSDPEHFKMWHSQWSRSDENACNFAKSVRAGFAPVYYRTIGNVTRWQAAGAAKYFSYYLVEFPIGEQ